MFAYKSGRVEGSRQGHAILRYGYLSGQGSTSHLQQDNGYE